LWVIVLSNNSNFITVESSMLVDFVDHPYPRINTLMKTCIEFFNLHKYYSNSIIYYLPTKLRPHEQVRFCIPMNIDHSRIKMIPLHSI
jgi:hypothetical protein